MANTASSQSSKYKTTSSITPKGTVHSGGNHPSISTFMTQRDQPLDSQPRKKKLALNDYLNFSPTNPGKSNPASFSVRRNTHATVVSNDNGTNSGPEFSIIE